MLRDAQVSDELWALLEPLMPQDAGRPGRPWNDHRITLEGIIWRFRTGAPWRDLPGEFGAYQSVWERHRLWSTDGTRSGWSPRSVSTPGRWPGLSRSWQHRQACTEHLSDLAADE